MSYKIERILVPIDFSETSDFAVYSAAAMAMLFKAELNFIHVINYNEYYYAVLPETKLDLPPISDFKEEAKRKLIEIQKKIKVYSGIRAKLFVATGNIEGQIRKYTEKENISLIVMGTHGVSGYQELFIGSTAQRVVTLSNIPVLTLTKGKDIRGFKNILLAFDNSLYSRTKVNIAVEIADMYGANVHILGVLDSKEKVEISKFKIKLRSVEEEMRAKSLHCETKIIKGDNIAKAAITYAQENQCDLMVINTGHESRITGIFLGAFAQQIVNHANIPVLSVKPTDAIYTGSGTGSAI